MADFFTNPQFGVDTKGSLNPSLSGANALSPEKKATVTAPSTSTALNTAKEQSKSKKILRYPLKMLDKNTDYLEIRVLEFQAPGLDLSRFNQAPVDFALPEVSKSKKKTLHTIYLPIPSGISDSNAVGWGEGSLNPIEGFGAAAGKEVIGSGADIGAAVMQGMSAAGTALQSLVSDPKAQNALQTYMAGAAVQAAGGNTTGLGLVTRLTGAVLNNNQELLFQGPSLRSFNFTFDLSPRNTAEAAEIKQIIRIFKQAMAAKRKGPTSVQGLFIGPPEVFGLTYKTGSQPHKFLNKFKNCALTQMSVNYTGSGAYSTYPDGTPVHMQLTLAFQELNPIYSEDYDTGPGKDGVGY